MNPELINLLERFCKGRGHLTVLTGAGILAGSGGIFVQEKSGTVLPRILRELSGALHRIEKLEKRK